MTLKYVKKTKGSADKNGAKNVTCKRSLKAENKNYTYTSYGITPNSLNQRPI